MITLHFLLAEVWTLLKHTLVTSSLFVTVTLHKRVIRKILLQKFNKYASQTIYAAITDEFPFKSKRTRERLVLSLNPRQFSLQMTDICPDNSSCVKQNQIPEIEFKTAVSDSV